MFNSVPNDPVKIRFMNIPTGAIYSAKTFVINKDIPQKKSRMHVLAFHEGVPGHHLHRIMREQAKGPAFRSVLPFFAHLEGWATYAEILADEFGCYPDQESRLGYLIQQLRGTVGLVIDTGLHAKHWTYEQAVEYSMMTGYPRDLTEGAIERYMAWPGQICTYMVGRYKIIELRTKAQAELGDKFDLRDFHDVVLLSGLLPLDLLETEVQKYIDRTK